MLALVNMISFVASLILLLALIITYALFKELRKTPGKNIMSLAISLALAELLWMCGGVRTVHGRKSICFAVALANHYFFLVYFTSSSVIACHSCKIFTHKKHSRIRDVGRIFDGYLLIIWLIPAVFVLVVTLLDHFRIVLVDYGNSDHCWLGSVQSKLYFFLLPFGILVVFNLFLFGIFTAFLWKQRGEASQFLSAVVRRRRLKENIRMCLRLSTLLGFSWLFGLMHFVFAEYTEAFLHLFLIFVSLQGVFVSVSFLFNRKCFDLYHGLFMPGITPKSAVNRELNGKHTRKTGRTTEEHESNF